ncbi:mannos-6-phosphate isomerase [Infundibulicybe gibba]|nr:mannos-6-phosphate isomerase [Infundibulicybe gibba]
MGTHPTAPSRVASSGQILSEHLAAHPNLIGRSVAQKFGAENGNLPFLFKILSVRKALSIQTHPDKQTAEKLHAEHPNIYKDDNHKPEMALALGPFRALCGFAPLPKVALHLNSTPEIKALIPPSILDTFISLSSSSDPTSPQAKAALRDVFSSVMTADEETVKHHLISLVGRYRAGVGGAYEQDIVDLVLRLDEQFPGDVGIFCAFLLNYITLNAGEAIYLGAGEPHAYISGDIIECMANSDNVIRAGLTPKLRDLPNLISGLTYTAAEPGRHSVQPTPFGAPAAQSSSTLYDPPTPEFSVIQVQVSPGAEEKHRPVEGPSLLIVTGGGGTIGWGGENLSVGTGDVVFVGADTEVRFTATREGPNLALSRAFVEA